ncbi:MAG: hypothetical protein KDJ23_16605, partial [Rhodoblastus sp.]|nr:hypothetical protein [Rhodoblastus sp.]
FLCAAAQHFLGFGFRSAPTSAAHWLVFLTILFTAVGVTWGFSRLTEARTDIVRRFARNLFDKRPQPQVTGAPAKG